MPDAGSGSSLPDAAIPDPSPPPDRPARHRRNGASLEHLGVIIAILTSLLSLYFAFRSSAQSDEALRLNRADFQSKRDIRLLGDVRAESLMMHVHSAEVLFPVRRGDTLVVPAGDTESWTYRPSDGVDVSIVSPRADTSYLVRYNVLSIQPVRPDVILRWAKIDTPWSIDAAGEGTRPAAGGAREIRVQDGASFVVWGRKADVPVSRIEGYLTAWADSLASARGGFMPRSSTRTLPLMIEVEYVAEGEVFRNHHRYDLIVEYQLNQYASTPAAVAVKGLSYAMTFPSDTSAATAVRAEWERARKSFLDYVAESQDDDMRRLLQSLGQQAVDLHSATLSISRSPTGRIIARPKAISTGMIPVGALRPQAGGLSASTVERISLHMRMVRDYNAAAARNQLVLPQVPGGDTSAIKPLQARLFGGEMREMRVAALALGLWAAKGVSDDMDPAAAADSRARIARGEPSEFKLITDSDTLIVVGETTNACSAMTVLTEIYPIPRLERVRCRTRR